jgi:hypothetical protein
MFTCRVIEKWCGDGGDRRRLVIAALVHRSGEKLTMLGDGGSVASRWGVAQGRQCLLYRWGKAVRHRVKKIGYDGWCAPGVQAPCVCRLSSMSCVKKDEGSSMGPGNGLKQRGLGRRGGRTTCYHFDDCFERNLLTVSPIDPTSVGFIILLMPFFYC